MPFPMILNASPNCDDRPFGTEVDMIVLHYTGMETADSALERLCDDSDEAKQRGRVSAHYMIDTDGTTYAMVDERDRAWHAGDSYWKGRRNLNDVSIGIELVNPGHELGYTVFPRTQLDSLVELCASIYRRYPIKQENFLAHSDVAPGRKIDPGEKFNWRYLARAGFGYWPEGAPQDYPKAQFYLSSSSTLKNVLTNYGYNPDVDLRLLCQAFNRHFGRSASEELSFEAAASLSWLNRNVLKNPV